MTTINTYSADNAPTVGETANYEAMRNAMVASQLRTNAVSDQRVVAAMARVPRETFIPTERRELAYRDTAILLGGGRSVNLPMATGRLLTEAYLTATDRVLLIGAATGYTAAVLSEIVADVVAVESNAALVAIARETLAGVPNVRVIEGPMQDGYAEGAPYDVLIVDGAIAQIPELLVAQVRTDGRVVSGLADQGVTRLASGRKTEGGFALAAFVDVDCVALPGFDIPQPFRF